MTITEIFRSTKYKGKSSNKNKVNQAKTIIFQANTKKTKEKEKLK